LAVAVEGLTPWGPRIDPFHSVRKMSSGSTRPMLTLISPVPFSLPSSWIGGGNGSLNLARVTCRAKGWAHLLQQLEVPGNDYRHGCCARLFKLQSSAAHDLLRKCGGGVHCWSGPISARTRTMRMLENELETPPKWD
jgi:hypothetical protein